MADLIVFDLDGTLIDSHGDIYRCVGMALRACGRPEVSDDDVAAMLGAPLHVYHERLAVPVPLDEFVDTYRALQDRHGLEHTRPFEGIDGLLDGLEGVPRAIASTKPSRRVRSDTAALGIDHRFDLLMGTDQPPYKPDPAVLLRVLSHFPDATPSASWMVGDLPSDILAGRAAGMRTLGVTWGGIEPALLAAVEPDALASTPAEARAILSR